MYGQGSKHLLPRSYRQKLSRLWFSKFGRSVAVVATGTAGAQVVTMAFSPLITRIYGPDAFGVLGTFNAILAVLTPMAALAYPIAIVLPREDGEALGLVRLSIYVSFFFAFLLMATVIVGNEAITASLGVDEIGSFLWLVPIAMLFSSWVQIAQQWLIRKERFRIVARSSVMYSLTVNSAKAGFGWMYPLASTLVFLTTVGHAVHAVFLSMGAVNKSVSESAGKISAERIPVFRLAKKYSDFSLYRAPQNVINAAAQGMPVLLLASYFGPSAAGFYALAQIVLGLSSGVIGKSVSDVFYPKIVATSHNNVGMASLIIKTTAAMLALGIIPAVVIMVFGPELFGFVFGGEWVTSGEYAKWLVVLYLFNFVNKPAVASVPVLNLQRGLLVYEILSTVGRVGGLLAGFYWYESAVAAIVLFSFIGAVSYCMMIFWIIRRAIRRDANEKAG